MLNPNYSLGDVLPDSRPISAIQVIESLDRCPKGFQPIRRTFDLDQDADLRDSFLFKSSGARYLCVSKTVGAATFVIRSLHIQHVDKVSVPKGYSVVERTADSEQRPWKKRQLCYQLVEKSTTTSAVTDIIVCNRSKRVPEGFRLAGEVNGTIICFKMGNAQDTAHNGVGGATPTTYPQLDGDYEILLPSVPTPKRPAPKPPSVTPSFNGHQSTHSYLDGVPFVTNPRYTNATGSDMLGALPSIKAKTMDQLMREYHYPFTVERQNL